MRKVLDPMRLVAAAALVFLYAAPAWSYIDRSYTLGQIIAECDYIAVMKVHAVSKERGAIIYKKVADLKGKFCNFSFLLKSRAADWLSGSYTGKHDDGASRD